MDTIRGMKKFGPWWVTAACLAFTPIAVVHWLGIVALVATVLIVAALKSAKVKSTSISNQANVPGFGLLSFSLFSARGKRKALLAVPAVAALAAAAIFAPVIVQTLAQIAFSALLALMLVPVVAPFVNASQLAKRQTNPTQQNGGQPRGPQA